MPYCSKCGREIPSDAAFCPSCGAQTRASAAYGPSTEFDRLTRDRGIQEHWLSRLIAFIIDSVIFAIGFAIVALIVWFSVGFPAVIFGGNVGSVSIASFPFNTLGILPLGWLWGVLFWLYFALAEGLYGKTPGKSMMHLHVVTTDGHTPDYEKTFIRNFSKIYWLLLLLDIIGGLFSRTEPGQKFSDHFAGTIVAKEA